MTLFKTILPRLFGSYIWANNHIGLDLVTHFRACNSSPVVENGTRFLIINMYPGFTSTIGRRYPWRVNWR